MWSSQWGLFVFQLINKVPQPHCALGHHYYSPVGGLSRIWIRNFTWIVGERSKEDKILSLSLKALQTFPTVYRVPPPIALSPLISFPPPPPRVGGGGGGLVKKIFRKFSSRAFFPTHYVMLLTSLFQILAHFLCTKKLAPLKSHHIHACGAF